MQTGDALAYRPVDDALMLPDDLPVENEVPRSGKLRPALDPAHVVLVRDKADLHAVLLVRGGQAEFLRQGTHLFFLIPAQRQGQA